MMVRLTSSDYIARGCAILGVGRDVLVESKTRRRPIVRMRWAIMWCLRQQSADLTCHQLGYPLGIRDHSSVIYALDKARALVESGDAQFVSFINALQGEFKRPRAAWLERPVIERPACLDLLDCIPLDDVGPVLRANEVGAGGQGVRVAMDEIFRRRDEVAKSRADYEAQCLAAERARYGLSRQTAARPLSAQVA